MAAGALQGKVAIVTGGASGIGRATSGRFVEQGASVLVADLDGEAAERAAAFLTGVVLPVDGGRGI